MITQPRPAPEPPIAPRDPEGPRAGPASPRRIPLRGFISSADNALLAREIPALVEEIRLRKGRRYAEGPRGRLWVKRMIRESLSHGGVPFSLPMKRRQPRRPRVALVVDVSHSVARAAACFLLICRGLSERIGRTECYFFVDRIVRATDAVRLWRGPRVFGSPFVDLLKAVPDLDLGAPSDYGRAFHQALALVGRSAGRETVLIVLGDARSNHRDPLAWAFEELAGRCRRVIWLNPEPHPQWNSGDSVMDVYQPACDVVCETRDLDGLARGIREILRNL